MVTKNDPGAFDCYARALPDEPLFTLLARDPSAPFLIEQWADRRASEIALGARPRTDGAMIGEALICAKAMREWRRANMGRWNRKPESETP